MLEKATVLTTLFTRVDDAMKVSSQFFGERKTSHGVEAVLF
jgi:hypothetical protein